MSLDRTPTSMRHLPNTALYFDCPQFPDALRLCGMWVEGTLGMLRSLFGTDWTGRWLVSQTFDDFGIDDRRNADPRLISEMLTERSVLGYLGLAMDEPSPVDSVHIKMERYGDNERYLMMHLSVGLADVDASIVDKATELLLGMVEQVAGSGDLLFGEGTPTFSAHEPFTRLDLLLKRNQLVSTAEAQQVLRGYEWLTICPNGLAQRLGDPHSLQASGAFHRAIQLPTGLLLQATEDPQDFDEAAAKRVWEALRPILPTGRPKAFDGTDFTPLVMQDATA